MNGAIFSIILGIVVWLVVPGFISGGKKSKGKKQKVMACQEVKRIVNEQYERAKSILRQYAKEHNQIRDMLVEKEVIFHDDVEKILGKRQWKSRTDEIIEINKKEEESRISSRQEDKGLPSPTDEGPAAPKVADPDDDAGTPPPFNK